MCILGDQRLGEEASKAFKKDKKLIKGIAFPTCISVNNCICHYSPLTTEPDQAMADGDMVKIDMGAHIDGFIAVVAHTLVLGASADAPVTGRKADAMLAAHLASEAALRLVEPFQVHFDKEGAHVAQYKFTVLLMPNGPHKITGLPFDESLYKSEKSLADVEILKLLKTSANPKAAKKKKKAAEKAVSDETGTEEAPALVEQ